MNKFSIIIPVRNGGEYLKKAVESILTQTYVYFNVLILESGSTDDSIEYIKSIKDQRISLFSITESLGIEANWARILQTERNEFMTILGQDDILLPNYLEMMNALINQFPDASLYQTHFDFIDAKGDFLKPCLPMDEIQYAHEFLAAHLAQTFDSMATGYMFRSKDYDALGGIPNYPDLIFGDYELWIKLIAISYKVTSFQTCFYYRKHQSLSSTTKGNKYQQSFHRYILFIRQLIEMDDKFAKVVEKYGLEMLYFYCEKISHRLLKSPKNTDTISVADFIALCKTYADWLVPKQEFVPEKRQKIKAAKIIDGNVIARSLFLKFKKISQ